MNVPQECCMGNSLRVGCNPIVLGCCEMDVARLQTRKDTLDELEALLRCTMFD
jgi:hypothetical protein